MRHAENLHFCCYFQRVLALMGFVQGHVAHIGPLLGPTSVPDAPTQDQVVHVKLNLRPNVPKFGPQLAQVEPKFVPDFITTSWKCKRLLLVLRGSPMGSPLSPALWLMAVSISFVDKLERDAKKPQPFCQTLRYVDNWITD
jgi:hypothetical protein